jgi:hypothetical protein
VRLRALETLAHDTRYALRALKNSRGISALVILALAMGIDANTAI